MHEIDPDGDMILTLKNPCAPFAVWHEDDATPLPTSLDLSSQEPQGSDLNCSDEIIGLAPTSSAVTYRISSRHLSSASERSRKMRHQWEQKRESDGYFHISVEDWDSEALLAILNIIHLRNRQVPHEVSLEMLSKLAVIVDYFEFHEAVEVFSKTWIADLQGSLPTSYCRDLILWMWISHVFHEEDILKTVICTAVRHSLGWMEDLGLPIPEHIISQVDDRRREAAVQLVDGLRALKEGLQYGTKACSYECQCRFLGALIKGLDHFHVFDSTFEPLLGCGLTEVIKSTRQLRIPARSGRSSCDCTMNNLTYPFLGKVENDLRRLA